MNWKRWTQNELDILKALYHSGMELKFIAMEMGRNPGSVKSALERFKITPRKAQRCVKTETGVGWYFCAAHKDVETGKLHGHTWEVTAWFRSAKNAIELQEELKSVLLQYDHTELSDDMAWGEAISKDICLKLDGCREVIISRQAERIYARAVSSNAGK